MQDVSPHLCVTHRKNDITALKAIMENSPEDSKGYKRAAVVLACSEGIQGKVIARKSTQTRGKGQKLRADGFDVTKEKRESSRRARPLPAA